MAQLPTTERKEINKQAISRRTIRKVLRAHDNLMHFLRQNEGLTIVEYAIAAGLIVAAVVVTFGILGTAVDAIILTVVAAL